MRHQLPAYSPLSLPSLFGSAVANVVHGEQELDAAARLIAREFSADTVLLVDSGRAALQIAIDVACRRHAHRRRVALPAFQCFEVGAAAVGAGCEIALYDVDPETLQPDLESLEHALREGACAVVIAPLYGIPVDWGAITALVQPYGAAAIEDAAQTHGAEWSGRRVGSFGDLSVLSFGRGKGWTGGGGGALCLRGGSGGSVITQSRLSAKAARLLITTTLQWAAGRPSLYGIPSAIPALGLGETRYRAPTPPIRMSSFSAALLSRTFGEADVEASVRRASGELWRRELQECSAAVPRLDDRARPGYIRFPWRVTDGAARLRATPAALRAGMATTYPKTLWQVAEVGRRVVGSRKHPGAECLVRELVTLPTHSQVAASDRAAILSLCRSWSSRRA